MATSAVVPTSHRHGEAPIDFSLPGSLLTAEAGRLFELDRLGLTTYFLALLYLFLACYATNQLRRIHLLMGAGFDSQKLFHTFLTILVWLRCVAFGLLSLFEVLQSDLWYPAMILLFTLPEYFILSTYLLLWFQWLECYITSHDQFIIESKRRFRRKWLIAFFVMSLLIYLLLSILYILLILRSSQVEDSVVLIILWTTAFGNLILPALMLVSALYFMLLMSGFSFSSDLMRIRVERTNFVMGLWTIARMVRGALLIVSILYKWQQTLNELYLGMSFVSILFVTEVLPLLAALDFRTIELLLFGEGSQADGGFEYAEISEGTGRTSAGPQMSPQEAFLGSSGMTADELLEEAAAAQAQNHQQTTTTAANGDRNGSFQIGQAAR
jgi:hypothetical protein